MAHQPCRVHLLFPSGPVPRWALPARSRDSAYGERAAHGLVRIRQGAAAVFPLRRLMSVVRRPVASEIRWVRAISSVRALVRESSGQGSPPAHPVTLRGAVKTAGIP